MRPQLRHLIGGLAIAANFAVIGCGEASETPAVATAPTRAADVDPAAGLELMRVVSKEGHASHPTWYHVSQIAELGGSVLVAFNGNSRTRLVRLNGTDFAIAEKQTLNRTKLGGNTDTTGTDTNRHDVPTIATDVGGRLHVFYGGGSISGRSSKLDGPLSRSSVNPANPWIFGPERAEQLGGGSAFDFEAVRDAGGTLHLFGQHGSGDAGSLFELRIGPGGERYAARKVIDGGPTRKACVRDGRARGCNRFAIARSAVGPDGTMHLVWGWSEASLSGKCGADVGYCDHDLFYARSSDNGASWKNASNKVTRRVPAAPIAHDDKRFRIARGHIGLFKAIAATPNEVLVVFTRRSGKLNGKKTKFALRGMRISGGRRKEESIAKPDKAWDSAPVLRADGSAHSLWMATGSRIVRFSSAAPGSPWRSDLVHRGAAWSLTGVPSSQPGRQLLLWRGPQAGGQSEVVLGLAPAAQP